MSLWGNLAKDGLKETAVEVVDNLTFTMRVGMYLAILLLFVVVGWYSKSWVSDNVLQINQFQQVELEKESSKCPKS